MHSPACETWEQHVDKAYRALGDHDTYDLLVFTDFLISSYDEERLIADEENREWFDSRRDEAAA